MRVLKFVAIAIAAVAVLAFVVMSLWNWILPPVTGWHTINYWQALGLIVLSKILFGGLHAAYGPLWKRRMMQRFAEMTPEEREKFREAMRARCGNRGDNPTPASSKL
jgi:hypothetical protein